MRRLSALIALLVLAGWPVPALAEPSPGAAYPNDPELQRAYEDGFRDGAVRGEDRGYSSGRDAGYDDGFAAGLSEGEQNGRDAALREDDEQELADEVEAEAESTPTPTPSAIEGGNDVAVDATPTDPVEDDGPGIPWWPLAFAVAATAWFVTRRRRLDAEDASLAD